ncbi:MAG: 16S rRNA (uracil(1498)-N(3))-methyltransferase [Timaviella obliquedivisa GSE-PSE-MK23-08B]|jgi:16S rRNA (uracil1498-N3)-methyltransferase|nr:16S rRNA (uracil(1498)-N(3))-methyltransferase [Timaviella obliquedivisa GSE-PSE-MK23-08B]
MAQLQRLTIAANQISGQQIQINAQQRHYLHHVLRLNEGDRFIAMDGRGNGWLASLKENALTAEMLEPVFAKTELPISVTLLIALPKNGMDDIVRQATELGVERILPIISDRTVLKPSPQKGDRWQRIAQEAAEQCERQIIPQVFSPISWSEALQTWNSTSATCYLCEARGHHPHLLNCLPAAIDRLTGGLNPESHGSIALATGSEGGWTPAEIERAIAAGYQPVSLGSRILRAVTAPLVALSLVGAACDAMNSRERLS